MSGICFDYCKVLDLGCVDSSCDYITLPLKLPTAGLLTLVGDANAHKFSQEVVAWYNEDLKIQNTFNEYSTLIFKLIYKNNSIFTIEKEEICYEFFKVTLTPLINIRDTEVLSPQDLIKEDSTELLQCKI